MKRITSILIVVILTFSCSDFKHNNDNNNEELNALRVELDSIKKLNTITSGDTKGQIATFLTFQDSNAEEAMNFYISIFENSKMINLNRWGKDGPGEEGKVMSATFVLNGNLFMCSDSPPIHEWGFTPAVSNFVECKDEKEIERLFSKLSENGQVMLPIDNYGWSSKFAFVEDKFGVSWQLNLQ